VVSPLFAAALAVALALGTAPAALAADPATGAGAARVTALPDAVLPPLHTTGLTTRAAHRAGLTYPAEVNGHWSGYAVTGAAGTMTSVTSNWVQPRIDYSVPGYAATWVGLDGVNDNTVEQIGTTAESVGGLPTYFAWYEMTGGVNPAPVPFTKPLEPGDNLTASVTYAADNYTLYLRDLTEGWSQTVHVQGDYDNSSAEIVVETPTDNGYPSPLTQCGYVDFFGNSVNGQPLNSTAADTNGYTMDDPDGGGVALPSATDAQGNFAVTYGPTNTFNDTPLIADNSSAGEGGVYLTTPSAISGVAAPTSYLGQDAWSDPVVTALPGGGLETAFEGSTPAGARLFVAGTSFTFNTQLGMALHTHPAIAVAASGSWEVAFQANTGQLWLQDLAHGGRSLDVGITLDPSITG
jgi:hypothetical protein